MTDRELLTQALEALETCKVYDEADAWFDIDKVEDAAAAMRERLAREDNGGKTGWAPWMLQDDDSKLSKWLANRPGARRDAMAAREEQEPVAWVEQDAIDWLARDERSAGAYTNTALYKNRDDYSSVPLYTAPQPALRERLSRCDRCGKPTGGEGHIHTCSPQREPTADEVLASHAKRLALELEALLLSCEQTAVVSKWWASAHMALGEYQDDVDRLYPQDHVSPLGKD